MPETYTGNEGTTAFAAGMAAMDGFEKKRQGYLAINKTRDYIVQWCNAAIATAKAYTDAKVGAIVLSWANITGKPASYPASPHTHSSLDFNGMRFGEFQGSWRTAQNVSVGADLFADSGLIVAGGASVGNVFSNPYARSNGVSGWLAVGVSPSGVFGFQMSSRRFKKDIETWSPDRQAILAMRLVQFRYKSDFDDAGTGEIDHGLIAEELHELGLSWLVAYDSDGLPVTVKYDRIGLALLDVVQDHEARLNVLEAR